MFLEFPYLLWIVLIGLTLHGDPHLGGDGPPVGLADTAVQAAVLVLYVSDEQTSRGQHRVADRLHQWQIVFGPEHFSRRQVTLLTVQDKLLALQDGGIPRHHGHGRRHWGRGV